MNRALLFMYFCIRKYISSQCVEQVSDRVEGATHRKITQFAVARSAKKLNRITERLPHWCP